MREDLLDAQASVDWAIAQLPVLDTRITTWGRNDSYSVRIDADHQNGKKAYYVSINPIPAIINAEAGVIINSIRSALDLLANVLAARNGHVAPKDVYFPISNSLTAFLDTKRGGGKEKIKRLSASDQAIIEGLAPYKGGNDLLFALHQLDIARKHRRLIAVVSFPRGIGMSVPMEISRRWAGFEDKAPIAWTDINAPDCKIDLGVHIAIKEGGSVEGQQVVAALCQFASLANSIIKLFDTPQRCADHDAPPAPACPTDSLPVAPALSK